MEHRSQEALSHELLIASKHIVVGGLYAHYKDRSKLYQVLYLGVLENTEEICVIYQAQYDKKLIFVRPLTSWLDPAVDTHGTTTARFRVEL